MKKLLFFALIMFSGCSCLKSQIPPQFLPTGTDCNALLPDYRIKFPARDNCSVASYTQTPAPGFQLTPQNMSTTVVLKAVDGSGNTRQASFTVTLIDTIKPVIDTTAVVPPDTVPPIPPPVGITYYVSTTGNNTNTGDQTHPWQTLSYAVTQAKAGETIYMMPGVHSLTSLVTIPAGVSLAGAGDASVITSSSFTSEGQYMISLVSPALTDGNQSISYLKFDGNSLVVAQALFIQRRNNVKIHHCTFVNFKYQALIWSGDGTGNIGSDPYANVVYPTAYVTGSEFYNNILTGTSVYDSYGHGALWIGGQEGMLIHDNVIDNSTRLSGSPGYCIKTQAPAFVRGAKIYNNTLITANNAWLFAIEGFFFYGVEIYNNNIVGAIDINFISKSDYTYGVWIHNNTIGPATSIAGYTGMIFEFNTSDVIVEKNRIRNSQGIMFTPRTNNIVSDYRISYNIFEDIRSGGYHILGGTGSNTSTSFNNIKFYNNVFDGPALWGLSLFGSWHNFEFKNNIISGTTWYWLGFRDAGFDNINISNNILYNNSQSNAVFFAEAATNYTNANNITLNPLFTNVSANDFTLTSSSPALGAGVNVGLTTDFLGNPVSGVPNIGAYN